MKCYIYIIVLIYQVSFGQTALSNAKTEKSNEQSLENIFPDRTGYVNDFEKIFTNDELESLEILLKIYEEKTSNEIVIVTVPSIKPYSDFNQYSLDLSNYWGVGKKGKDNGLTIIFSKSFGEIRISTGLGTQKIITDSFCKDLIDKTMIPKFKNDDYYNAINESIAALIEKCK